MIDINYIYPIMEGGITPACLISFENLLQCYKSYAIKEHERPTPMK